MASTFAFGFTGDDIDAGPGVAAGAGDLHDEMQINSLDDPGHKRDTLNPQPPQSHTLSETLFTLPSSISYNTLSIPFSSPLLIPSSAPSNHQSLTCRNPTPSSLNIRRRSIFDILLQLKAEADIPPSTFPQSSSQANSTGVEANTKSAEPGSDRRAETEHNNHDDLIASLEGCSDGGGRGASDLRPGVYEGGFKTWECSVDLASYLASCLEFRINDSEHGHKDSGRGLEDELGRFIRRLGGIKDEGQENGGEKIEDLDVVELGAGSAMPSLVLLRRVLDLSRTQQGPGTTDVDVPTETNDRDEKAAKGEEGVAIDKRKRKGRIRFLLCDYNVEVLRLLTAANVLLQLVPDRNNSNTTTTSSSSFSNAQDKDKDENETHHNQNEGDLDLDADPTKNHILSTLPQRLNNPSSSSSITIDFISGAWGAPLLDLLTSGSTTTSAPTMPTPSRWSRRPSSLPPSESEPEPKHAPLLILASETIYSPASMRAFTATLMGLLKSRSRSRNRSKSRAGARARSALALVAAKKMYFGVGGGVDAFVGEVRKLGGVVDFVEVEEGGSGSGSGSESESGGVGVGRVILRVRVAAEDEN